MLIEYQDFLIDPIQVEVVTKEEDMNHRWYIKVTMKSGTTIRIDEVTLKEFFVWYNRNTGYKAVHKPRRQGC